MTLRRKGMRQGGAVLIVSLIFLLLLGLLATTVSETNLLQLQMAGNDESRMEVNQRALALIDAVLDDMDNLPVVGKIGYRICRREASLASAAGCDERRIRVPSLLLDDDAHIDYYVERAGPLETPLPFLDEDIAGSATALKLARQNIIVRFDRADQNRGTVELVQGYLQLIVSATSMATSS